MKKVYKTHTVCLVVLFCLTLFISGCTESSPSPSAERSIASLGLDPIVFPLHGDDITIDQYDVTCDMSSLSEKADMSSATVYYEPEGVSPEKLMSHLQFSETSAGVVSEELTTYTNDQYSLDIYKNGNFCLFSNFEEDEPKAITLTDAECVQIADDFLQQNDLLCDDLIADQSIGQNKSVNETGTIVIGKVVYYRPKTALGTTVLGNSRVAVHIDSDGRVSQLIYNHLHYKQTADVSLLSLEEACDTVIHIEDPHAVYFEVSENTGKQLTITNVRVVYYENVMADVPNRQPVYLFEGGEEEQFVVALPAAISD